MINKINSKKVMKIALIVYAVILVTGILFSIFAKLRLDINFSGGARVAYSYEGNLKQADFEKQVKTSLGKTDFTLSQNEGINGGAKTYVISIAGNKSLSTEKQEKLTNELTEKFKKNKVELSESNSVSSSVAGSFFAKSMVAIVLTAILVVIYVGIRFRKIGGVSAALTALVALVLDLLVTFCVCAIFRLQIDSNYMAVVLTILGYSLNDTIVVYDRVRETKKYYPQVTLEENMNMSIKGVMTRNIVTSVTTIAAVLTIIVVAEICGLTSLRTFGIPMAFGLLSGCFSSMFIAGPLWVCWKQRGGANKKKA
ncbi:MAG: protein translocase subunit SecF [Clostridia bacterium]|nr:protein translocase subunit SecF [Clostridia bacterium]